MKLRDFCTVKVGLVIADFWIVRRGSRKAVGMPVRDYNPEHYGVVVISPDLLPDYLFVVLLWIHSTGVWEIVATGSTELVNLRKKDILDLPVVKM